MSGSAVNLMLLFAWLLLWSAGGILLVQALFRLPRREVWLAGAGVGMIAATWLVNWLARLVSLPLAAWLAGALVLAPGLWLALVRKLKAVSLLKTLLPPWGLALALAVLTALFTLTGRGLGIFDDYQNLPTVSLMAAGDIPPHFALNPGLEFNYHYFVLLLAAQVMRLGDLGPWTALDLARAFIMALTLLLAGLWTRRLVRSSLAQWLTVWFVALSGGVRWLFLLLPARLIQPVSEQLQLLGSAAQSGDNLSGLLTQPWSIEGAGPAPFPFMFVSGLNNPLIMIMGGFGVMHVLILLLLLLTAGRERGRSALAVFTLLLAALALSNEVTFLLVCLGLALAVLLWSVRKRSLKLPQQVWLLAAAAFAGLALALAQGGVLTGFARGLLAGTEARSAYFEGGFQLAWPPRFISAHLGPLLLTRPLQAGAALLEIGPVILLLPLLCVWGWKALKREKWVEAGLIASTLVSLCAVFVQYEGTAGVTATTRLYGNLLVLCTLYAVPLAWLWAARRKASVRPLLGGLAWLATLGGSLLLGIQLLAAPKPVYGPFLTDMDQKMYLQYWDRLEPGALVFDPVGPRSPTIFGRPTRSHVTWYSPDEAWAELAQNPDPLILQAAGFDYVYVDKDYRKEHKQWLDNPCVSLMQQVDGSKEQYNGVVPDFRQLLDIRACE